MLATIKPTHGCAVEVVKRPRSPVHRVHLHAASSGADSLEKWYAGGPSAPFLHFPPWHRMATFVQGAVERQHSTEHSCRFWSPIRSATPSSIVEPHAGCTFEMCELHAGALRSCPLALSSSAGGPMP